MEVVFAFLILFAGSVHALGMRRGVDSSGGGTTVVCRDSFGRIRSAELLDLYEAQKTYSLSLVSSTGSAKEDYFLSVDRTYKLQGYPNLAQQRNAEIYANYRQFFKAVKFLAHGKTLALLGDVGA